MTLYCSWKYIYQYNQVHLDLANDLVVLRATAVGRFVVQNDLCFSLLHTNLFYGFRRLGIQSISHMGYFFRSSSTSVSIHIHPCLFLWKKPARIFSFITHERKVWNDVTMSKLWRNSHFGWIIALLYYCLPWCKLIWYFLFFFFCYLHSRRFIWVISHIVSLSVSYTNTVFERQI